MKKHASLAHQNGFLPSIFAEFAKSGERYLPPKSVINMIWLLVPVFDWSIIMIGLGDLPPRPISSLPLICGFSFMSGVAKKSK
jgi:hypothetical protein